MVHSLIPMSVDIKTRVFENPARLVNAMELTCAIGMAYAQAGLAMPELESGIAAKEFWNATTPQISGNPRVTERLQHVIMNYIFKKDEKMDDDCIVTLELGYKF